MRRPAVAASAPPGSGRRPERRTPPGTRSLRGPWLLASPYVKHLSARVAARRRRRRWKTPAIRWQDLGLCEQAVAARKRRVAEQLVARDVELLDQVPDVPPRTAEQRGDLVVRVLIAV